MRNLSHPKHFGIWGLGKVGKSAIEYLHTNNYSVCVMDKRILTSQEEQFLHAKKITYFNETEQESFFNSCEFIIPSPGVNISLLRYATQKNKWVHELDFFYTNFHKPIIAITGSIGKTSVTHIFDQLLKKLSIPVTVGGNIGTATFDLINNQNTVDYALLEVSSFQLNYCKNFAPTLAVWTNFHPNHLDHHGTEKEYFLAKNNMLVHQTKNQYSLIPFALRTIVSPPINGHKRSYFIATCPNKQELVTLNSNEQIYYIANNTVMRYAHDLHTPLISLTPMLLNFSFIDNILLLVGMCDLLNLDPKTLHTIATTTRLPEHRMEKVGTINNVVFYNDSKSTTTASTLAAVEKLHNHPLHLFLGGLSKGVDRAPFIAQLKNKVKHIYCFGTEAEKLHEICIANQITATYFATLTHAFTACTDVIQPGDSVLFSPAGSSYDLYENYEERGKHFKKLVDTIHTK